MTLYEAIDHCMDVALNCKNKSCQTDHLQLAGWLKELADMRSMPRHAYWISKDGKFACSKCKPVVHAHWIPEKINKREHINSFQCSNCGHDVLNHLYYLSTDCDFSYCSYCGAQMDEESTWEDDPYNDIEGKLMARIIGDIPDLSDTREIEDQDFCIGFSNIDLSMDIAINDCDKALMILLGKGLYNSHVLHRDGYLSPENCWKNPAYEEDK